MKFREIDTRSNRLIMTIGIVILYVLSLLLLAFKSYLLFLIYFVVTIMLTHTYYGTYYYVFKKNFIIKFGFLKIKIKYKNIDNVKKNKKNINIKFKKFGLTIHPEEPTKFLNEMKEMV